MSEPSPTSRRSTSTSPDRDAGIGPGPGIDTGGWRPVPDPTLLTTEALRREVTGLKEIIYTRLDAMDQAIVLAHENVKKIPCEIEKQIDHLKQLTNETFSLHNEKFRSIQVQFTERDTRTEQTSRDSKVAVDAALQAAKEAVGEQNKSSALAIAKSEASTTKQIDQIAILLQSATKGIDDKFSDLKDRLTLIEGQKRGGGEVWGYLFGLAGLVAAIITAIIMAMHK